MKRNFLICSTLAFIALSGNNVDGMVPGRNNYQNLTVGNSFTIVWNCRTELERLGIDPREVLGIYRYGVAFDLLVPDCRNALIAADGLIAQAGRRQNPNAQRAAANLQIPQPRPVHVVQINQNPQRLAPAAHPRRPAIRIEQLQPADLVDFLKFSKLAPEPLLTFQSMLDRFPADRIPILLMFGNNGNVQAGNLPAQQIQTMIDNITQRNSPNQVKAIIDNLIQGKVERVGVMLIRNAIPRIEITSATHLFHGRIEQANLSADQKKLLVKSQIKKAIQGLSDNQVELLAEGNINEVRLTSDQINDLVRTCRSRDSRSEEKFIRIFGNYVFGSDTSEHKFFSILHLLNEIYRRNIGSFPEGEDKRDFSEAISGLIKEWVKNLQMWCLTHEISEGERNRLRQIVVATPAAILSQDTRSVLLGSGNGAVPAGKGIGHRNLPIFEWMEIYPVISANAQREIEARRIQFIQSVLPGIDVNQFLTQQDPIIQESDLSVLDMLTLKPVLLAPLLRVGDQNMTEEALIEKSMREIYNSLKNYPYLLKSFTASSFGQMFCVPIFRKLLFGEIPPELPGETVWRDVEAFVAHFMPKEIWNESAKMLAIRRTLARITDLETRGTFGNVKLQNSNIYLPLLHFPKLTITVRPESVRDIRARLRNERSGPFLEAVKVFDLTDNQIDQQHNSSEAEKNLWTSLRNAYRQDIAGRDSTYPKLQELICDDEFNEHALPLLLYATVVADGNPQTTLQRVFREKYEELNNKLQTLKNETFRQNIPWGTALGEHIRRLHDDTLTVTTYDAVLRYNQFVDAFQKHVNTFVSSTNINSKIDEGGVTIEELSSYETAKEKKFVPSQQLFGKWSKAFYNPAFQGSIGMLQYPPLLGNQDLLDPLGEPASLFLTPTTIGTEFYPYLGVHSKLLRLLSRIDPWLSFALAQQIYSLSFTNMFEQPLIFTPNSDSLPFPIFEKAVTFMKDARVVYTPRNSIDQINDYSVVSDDRSKYSLSGAMALIPNNDLNLIRTHGQLRNQCLYWLLRGFYICMTGDKNLSGYTVGEGRRAIRYSFPTNSQNFDKDQALSIVRNVFQPITRSMEQNPQLIPSHFSSFLLEHGDAGKYVGTSWHNAFYQFYDFLTEEFNGGVISHVWEHHQNEYGLYFNENAVQFITYYLMQHPNVLSLDERDIANGLSTLAQREGIVFGPEATRAITNYLVQHPDVNFADSEIDIAGVRAVDRSITAEIIKQIRVIATEYVDNRIAALGALASRWGHCKNGNVEGTLAAFAAFLATFDFNDFDSIMPMISYIAAQSIVNDVFDPGNLNEGEEATYWGNIISILGQDNRFGLLNERAAFEWARGADVVKQGFARKVVLALSACLGDYPLVLDREIAAHTNGLYDPNEHAVAPYEEPFRRLFIRNVRNRDEFMNGLADVERDVQNAINAIQDVNRRNEVRLYCEGLVSLVRNGYAETIKSMALKAVSPYGIINWLLQDGRDALLNMIFKAYKQRMNLPNELSLTTMSRYEKEALLFDAFNDFRLFQRAQRAAH